ncbi:beta-N-acetylhexosaminidase [Granulicella sibirica]|nr:beta-N-acetylhexosaminidase [Granulicella sibirica]
MAILSAMGGAQQFHNTLMPQPASLAAGSGSLALASTFAVETPGSHDPRLDDAIARATRRVENATGLPHAGTGVTPQTKLIVKVTAPGGVVQTLGEDESYSLKITSSSAEIDAPTDLGAMHGLETLIQLIQTTPDGYTLPQVTIEDTPRFRWRGLMIDCGRHFEPVAVIKRTLDGMAAVKLNVFHWHLTEDQGFRMESKLYPKLTALGSDGNFYTQEEARDVVAYARARGIRVVPEFEMPGHSVAWLMAYPELASGSNPASIRREFGVSEFAIDPTRDETYTFIDKFLGEMATIFPDAYIHIGGDESPAPDWKKNPRIIAFMKAHDLKDNDALQAYFNSRVLKTIERLHKHMVGWDEILTPGLPKDVVVQSWRGIESLSKGAKLGYKGVLSAPYYLDGMKPAGVHYLADPLPSSSDLTPDQRKLILGGEVCMWGEQLNARTIDSRIWPRTAAIAERFWSPENVRDVDDMYRRLAIVSVELETLGLTHLQSGDAGLRDLTGSQHIDVLRTFASVVEPVSFGERYKAQRTNQLTALDRFVDSVRPDPPLRYTVEFLTKRFLANPTSDTEDRTHLDAIFTRAAAAAPEAKIDMQASPRMADVAPRADQLVLLSQTAKEALGYLAAGNKAPAGWKARSMAQIDDAKKPVAIIRFTFIAPLTDLINAVSE